MSVYGIVQFSKLTIRLFQFSATIPVMAFYVSISYSVANTTLAEK